MAREFKDSGIYNEVIPLTWNVRKFGGLCSVVTDFVASGSFADLRANVHYLDSPDYAMLVRTTDLAKSNRSEKRVYISKESYDYLSNSNLFGGEIVLPNIGSIGDVYIVPSDLYSRMSLAPNAIMFKTNECDKYFYYYFQSKVGGVQLDEISQSTAMAKFNKTDLRQLRVLCPPYSEQQKIADYLDKVCDEVDEMVALQETMIEELKAYKQSVITEAVTKGLKPNVSMRNSGIDWIGEIPEHWEAKKLKYIVDYIESGTSVNAGNVPAQANEYGVLKTSAVSKYVFDATENKTVVSEEMDKVSCPVRKNTIIVSRMNTPELVGACGYVEKNYDNIFLPDRLWQVHFVDTVYVKFIWYALRGSNIRNYYSSLSVGSSSSMQNISQSQFSNGSIPIPSDVEEQCAIVSYLDTKCSEIDSLIDLKQAKIEELKEYKKSVIYEYVTGKKEIV